MLPLQRWKEQLNTNNCLQFSSCAFKYNWIQILCDSNLNVSNIIFWYEYIEIKTVNFKSNIIMKYISCPGDVYFVQNKI